MNVYSARMLSFVNTSYFKDWGEKKRETLYWPHLLASVVNIQTKSVCSEVKKDTETKAEEDSKPWMRSKPRAGADSNRCHELSSFTPSSIGSSQLRVVKHVFVSKLNGCESDIDTQGAVAVCTVTWCHI